MAGPRILVVRLGAMGDVVHTLPAVATLKHSLPECHITWVIERKWAPLLDDNRYLNEVVSLDRSRLAKIMKTWKHLHAHPYDLAIDFQGLIKSAMIAALAHPRRIIGFKDPREWPARLLYSSKVLPPPFVHVVDRNLHLAFAAGASTPTLDFPLPSGRPEGRLPECDFVLACPLAGWGSKQWPLENYSALGQLLREETGIRLVLNGPAAIQVENTVSHVSSIPGLIDATRRAIAVIGLDSGPLHLAAALGKPGVAIFGPTDPARNGPYRSNLKILRTEGAETTYKRGGEPAASMRAITPDMVFEALRPALVSHRQQHR